jgi:GTP-binding protein
MHITSATFIKSCPDIQTLPEDQKAQIACLGRSNVGKSSLINSLTKSRGLSHVSSTPGRTAFLNVFLINKDWYLIDLPGYGYAKRSKEERGVLEGRIFEYLRYHPTLALVIIDSNVGATDLDLELISFLNTEGVPYIIIANKIDKQSGNKRANTLRLLKQQFPDVPILLHSVKTEEGRTAILETIAEAVKVAKKNPAPKKTLLTS